MIKSSFGGLAVALLSLLFISTSSQARFLQTDPIGYADNIHLYAYVFNDPINNTDPTGLECVGDGETLTCDPPGDDTAPFQIPQPPGFPDYIGPDAAYYHEYRAEASTPDHNGSLEESIVESVAGNPTPGSNQQTATPEGALNDAGITPFSGSLGDNVMSHTTTDENGNTVVVNITVPGEHILNPGIVAQYVIPSANQTSVIVAGEGNGPLSVPANGIASQVFKNKIQGDIRRAIFNDTRRRTRSRR